jgi:hypothetical protein
MISYRQTAYFLSTFKLIITELSKYYQRFKFTAYLLITMLNGLLNDYESDSSEEDRKSQDDDIYTDITP